MKICMIFPTYPPNYQTDGIGDYTRLLVERLRAKGEDVHVLASGRYAGKDGKVIRVGGGKWGIKELVKTFRKIKDGKFDLVHLQYTPVTYGFGPVFKLLPMLVKLYLPRTNFVTTFHTLVGGPWITRPYAVFISFFSDIIISTNEEISHLFFKWLPMFGHKLAQVPIGANILRTSVDPSSARAALEKKFGIKKDAFILSNFGFINPGKGLEDMVKALSLLRDDKYYLVLIGAFRDEDAEYRHKLQGLIRMKGVEKNVIWVGETDEGKVSSLLKASDIYVVPYEDGICTRRGSLMAGIVNGLPIISTESRVTQSFFKDRENVLLVKRNDPCALAAAIKELAGNRALRERISSNIVALAGEFDWNLIADRTIGVYKKALKGPNRISGDKRRT